MCLGISGRSARRPRRPCRASPTRPKGWGCYGEFGRNAPCSRLQRQCSGSAPLPDLLRRLAAGDLLQAHWSGQIHKAWMRDVHADCPGVTWGDLEHTRSEMDRALPGAQVDGHRSPAEGLTPPNPTDRHVLAAARRLHPGDYPQAAPDDERRDRSADERAGHRGAQASTSIGGASSPKQGMYTYVHTIADLDEPPAIRRLGCDYVYGLRMAR